MDRTPLEIPSFWRSPAGLALLVAVAVGGFYLVTEHTAHLLGVLPYLFLLACPLMHVFMHRGPWAPRTPTRRTQEQRR